MTQRSRRKVLKGLAVTLPAAWATPVVESVITPAHAGVSGDDCEGCIVGFNEFGVGSFFWEGGKGPRVTTVYESANCRDNPIGSFEIVQADSKSEADELVGGCSQDLVTGETDAPCGFWACVDVEIP